MGAVLSFLTRRLLLGALVLAALSAASFCFFAWESPPPVAPGQARPSLVAQYWTWVKGLWGGPSLHKLSEPAPNRVTWTTGQPATIWSAFGHTAALLALALVLVALLSVGLALAATRRRSTLDLVARAVAYLAWALPAFLLALLVQLVVYRSSGSRGIGPFPLAGWPGACPTGLGVNAGVLHPCAAAGSGGRYLLNVLRYLTLPAATLALGFVGLHGRYLRSALLEALDAPFVTTARAKGLPERRVLVRHALRASLATFVGALLADFGAIFGAAMAVDWIFQLSGLGTVFVSEFPTGPGSIDVYSLEAVLLLMGAFVVASSLVAELAAFWLDPRGRAER